jgi:hypothetical protein
LENKLDRAVSDKVDKFRQELGEGKSSDKVIADRLQSGEIKLLSSKEILKKIREKASNNFYYYNTNLYVNELISDEDREKIEAEVRSRDKKINDYRDKLYKAKTNALDKIVLEGVDVETALAELDNIK